MLVSLVAIGVVACAAPRRLDASKPAATATSDKRPWSLNPPIGLALPDEAVVHVVSKGVGCSGTLITGSLVLTAHHCVVERTASGEILEKDLDPGAIEVEIGGDYLPWATVRVRAVVTPPCGYRGGHGDIALLVLSRRLVGIATMAVRLDRPAAVGEIIEPVGFGHCPMSTDGVHRIRREGGPVGRIGIGAVTAMASICPGDSGGPARSISTGEVVGIVSAGAMDETEKTRDPSMYTRIDKWRALFENAQAMVDGASRCEVPPVPGCEPQ